MYEEIFTVGILTSGLLGLNTAEASEVEKDMIEVDPLIENLKTKHPDWAITQVTLDEAAKVKEELENYPVLRGPAPPLTALYIDQIHLRLEQSINKLRILACSKLLMQFQALLL